MASQMSEDEIYEIARKRVEEKKGFFIHFIIYILVNILLVIIWAATDSDGGIPWFIFPLAGWGIGVLFHFLGVFVFNRQTGWERRQIEKEAERLRKHD